MRLKNMLGNFADFDMDSTAMSDQEFQDFTSNADLNRQLRESTKESEQYFDDVDFELELMHRDEVNVITFFTYYVNCNKEESID
ncbi:hypothetical protein O9993_04840 [Vibrio lentus]|nr:hypothetical protein [Vibrio lentus]